MTKPYTARSLKGAQTYVRQLIKSRKEHADLLDKYAAENKDLQAKIVLLAMLAADGPCFNNPLQIAQAKIYRDGVLRVIKLNPDGSFIP